MCGRFSQAYTWQQIYAFSEPLTLAEGRGNLQGCFHLSLNDVPEVRELFAWGRIETVELSYQAGAAQNTKRVREVISSNL